MNIKKRKNHIAKIKTSVGRLARMKRRKKNMNEQKAKSSLKDKTKRLQRKEERRNWYETKKPEEQ